jgi:hypothetical protein
VNVSPNLPRVLRDAIDRSRRIVEAPHMFPELTGQAFAPGERLRRRHRPRLEAIAQTVAALVRRCDRRTLRVGDQRDDGLCNGVPLAKLCEHTGLRPWRVARALRDLEAGGYVSSKQPVQAYRDADGNERHRGFPSVRVLSPRLFTRLGISEPKLSRARRHAAEEWKRRHSRPASAAALLNSRRAIRRATATRIAPNVPSARYSETLLALRAEHPDWPADRVRAEARRRLGL